MGLYANAELIWGIPIAARDEDGEPTPFWDEAADDWIDFAEIQVKRDGLGDPWDEVPHEVNNGPYGKFEAWKEANPEWVARKDAWYEAKAAAERTIHVCIRTYGHYEDPEQRAILGSPRVEPITADCWTPNKVESMKCPTDKIFSKANDAARSFNLAVNFYAEAGWWLVASFG